MTNNNMFTVYLPAVLLIMGVSAVNKEWVPYAAVIAAIAGGLKIVSGSKSM